MARLSDTSNKGEVKYAGDYRGYAIWREVV